MNWLARLKSPKGPDTHPTKTTETISIAKDPVFVVSVGTLGEHIQKNEVMFVATNDTGTDPDRWFWPHSSAMNTVETDTFSARLARFTNKGLNLEAGGRWADKLVIRDREQDDRHVCLECTHLHQGAAWRCGNWKRAGVASRARDAQLPTEFVNLLQRCNGFTQAITSPKIGGHHGQA